MPQVTEWPNKLGFDIGSAEVWKHKDKFRVFTEERVLLIPYSVTTSPVTALQLCEEQGLNRVDLDAMDYRDAEALFQATIPTQKELF